MLKTQQQDVRSLLESFAARFDARLAEFLTPGEGVPADLAESMRYSALAGGKRVRPFLTVRWCALCGREESEALPAAAAIECVHVFSLIHDDLPAMDDDDLRRGRPTNHKVYGEARAILAGDGLLTIAFELIARHVSDAAIARALVRELACGTGWAGMIGGQVADLNGESVPANLELTDFIHVKKTAKLFETACRMGAISAGAQPTSVDRAGRFGHWLGRAFQIADDLLDVTSTESDLGKGVGKDAAAGKQTYPAAIGVEAARAAARRAVDRAVEELADLDASADDLRLMARYVVERSN